MYIHTDIYICMHTYIHMYNMYNIYLYILTWRVHLPRARAYGRRPPPPEPWPRSAYTHIYYTHTHTHTHTYIYIYRRGTRHHEGAIWSHHWYVRLICICVCIYIYIYVDIHTRIRVYERTICMCNITLLQKRPIISPLSFAKETIISPLSFALFGKRDL